jgi:hypothetical protein
MNPLTAIAHAKRVEACFATLVHCAKNNMRCPTNGSDGVTYPTINALTLAGRIKVFIYRDHYRVVEILKGEASGLRTLAPSKTVALKRTIDINGGLNAPAPEIKRRNPREISLPKYSF